MFRRRRKPKVSWLPFDLSNRLGVLQGDATAGTDSGILQADLQVPAGLGYGAGYSYIYPLVKDWDATVSPNTTMADIVVNAYRLRRVVGRLFIGVAQNAEGEAPPVFNTDTLLISAGLFVGRVAPDNGAPIAAAGGSPPPYYGINTIENYDFPWFWQRSWILQNQALAALQGFPLYTFPSNNTTYNSKFDDHNVDTKVARVIAHDERLFLAINCYNWNGDAEGPTDNQVSITFDYRVLGTLRTNQGNRRNASR